MPRKKKESKESVVAPPIEIIPKVEAELVSVEQVEEMSLEDINKRKADLQARREQIMLSVDRRKLDMAIKTVTLMDNTLDQMSAMLLSGELDALAYSKLADAYEKLNKGLPSLSRLDTDCNGDFTEIHLRIKRGRF